MAYKRNFSERLKQRTRSEFLRRASKTSFYPYFYPATWRAKLSRVKRPQNSPNRFITAVPNIGAGIGHQMANWIAGLYAAEFFELRCAHSPFPDPEWEAFLGLGGSDPLAKDLVKSQGYRKVRLPRFDFSKPEEVARIREIIASYKGPVCFFCEMDQWCGELHRMSSALKQRFFSATARTEEQSRPNNAKRIAVHVRRGDICQQEGQENANLSMRWLDNNYYAQVLTAITEKIGRTFPYEIYLYTQDSDSELEEFRKFKNLNFCNKMGAIDSFRQMVFADIIVTSRSSFSFKPALLNRGLKVCPNGFWQAYPQSDDWQIVDASRPSKFNPNIELLK